MQDITIQRLFCDAGVNLRCVEIYSQTFERSSRSIAIFGICAERI
jgi:hypothetical protein